MDAAAWLLLAIVAAYGCALAAPLARRAAGGRAGALLGGCLVPLILACPALIPAAHAGLRAISAFISVDLALRVVDTFRRRGRDWRGFDLSAYLRFLMPFPMFSVVFPDHKRRVARPEAPGPHLARLVGGIAGCAAAIGALRAVNATGPMRSHFVLGHAAMLIAFVVAIESISRALWGLEHLAGFDTTPIVRHAYRSRTVAEFWRRYNGRVHDWLDRNVFRPAGGRRRPARAVMLTFLVSGLFHEAMFGLATSRWTGYQLAFFAIQGPATLASGRMERLARRGGMAGQIAAHGATILFLAATSVLFFDGVRRVFPFIYAARSPLP